MTTFKSNYTTESVRTLKIKKQTGGVYIGTAGGLIPSGIQVSPADDAAIALAVMEAAQHETQNGDPGSADYARNEAINWLMTARDRAAKEAAIMAKESARGRRRDEIANEITDEYMRFTTDYSLCHDGLKSAIDRIIDLENQE